MRASVSVLCFKKTMLAHIYKVHPSKQRIQKYANLTCNINAAALKMKKKMITLTKPQ